MRQRISAALIVLIAFLGTASLWAHHSVSAIFEMSKRITLTGTLTRVDWVNPHIMIAIDAKTEGGKIEAWVFESNPPAWFRRVSVTRNDLAKAIRQTVTVEVLPAKDGSLYGYLQRIKMPDGNSLELVNPEAK